MNNAEKIEIIRVLMNILNNPLSSEVKAVAEIKLLEAINKL